MSNDPKSVPHDSGRVLAARRIEGGSANHFRFKRKAPDAERGRFLVSYYHQGKLYGASINGNSHADAHAHLMSMSRTASIVGERVAEVPVNIVTLAPVGLFVRLAIWLRNLWGRA